MRTRPWIPVLLAAGLLVPAEAQWRNSRPGPRDGQGFGYGHNERDNSYGIQGDLRRGVTFMGRGDLRLDRGGRIQVQRIFARETQRGELVLAIDAWRGRDQVARAVIRKWKDDRIEGDLVQFNGRPARGKVKLRFDDRRGYLERAEIDGRVFNDKVKLDFRR